MKVSTTFETTPSFGDAQHTIRIGNHAIRANSKVELQAKVSEAVDKAFTNPKIGIAKVGNQVMVVVEHLGMITTYAADIKDNGICQTRETGVAPVQGDVNHETALTGAALHLFKCDPVSYENLFDGKVPAGMPESRVSDWQWYAKGISHTSSLTDVGAHILGVSRVLSLSLIQTVACTSDATDTEPS
jgi:hypothetical protein